MIAHYTKNIPLSFDDSEQKFLGMRYFHRNIQSTLTTILINQPTYVPFLGTLELTPPPETLV